jgi:hypothetical protein
VSNAEGYNLHCPDRTPFSELVMHLVVIGGSDAGISAALRAQELKAGAEITVLVADDYPNFSICGLPYFHRDRRQARETRAPRKQIRGCVSAAYNG